jgi:hypothetical protein
LQLPHYYWKPKVESLFRFFAASIEDDETEEDEVDDEGDEENEDFGGNDSCGGDSDGGESVIGGSDTHFELGEEFKETITLHALYWYTGEADKKGAINSSMEDLRSKLLGTAHLLDWG